MTFTFGPYVERCFRRSLRYRTAAVATAAVGAGASGCLYVLSLRGAVQTVPQRSCLISCVSLGLAAVLLAVDMWLSVLAHRRGEQEEKAQEPPAEE